MTARVVTADVDYRVAVAELPRSARLDDDPRGALVVTTGDPSAVGEAVASGAAAVIVAHPTAGLPSVAVPVILDRALLRPDLAAEATPSAAPLLVQVEASAAAADLAATLRDALGWARVLAGSTLQLRSRQVAPDGVAALLEGTSPSGMPVPVSLVVSSRPATAPWIRATAIGPRRCEVTLDGARGLARVERAAEAGRSRSASRWESGARLAIRRAIAALEGTPSGDAEAWALDDELASGLAHPALA